MNQSWSFLLHIKLLTFKLLLKISYQRFVLRLSSTGSKTSEVTERLNRMSVGSNESSDPAKTTSRNLDFKIIGK